VPHPVHRQLYGIQLEAYLCYAVAQRDALMAGNTSASTECTADAMGVTRSNAPPAYPADPFVQGPCEYASIPDPTTRYRDISDFAI
jgi:hypothetical protein